MSSYLHTEPDLAITMHPWVMDVYINRSPAVRVDFEAHSDIIIILGGGHVYVMFTKQTLPRLKA